MNGISLTASMRSNLLSLQNISGQVSSTQNKLATGNKINSAIDNPGSYYTARSLNNRADDLNALLDSMGQAISTIKAATEGIESATEFLEQAKAVANQTLENCTSDKDYIKPIEDFVAKGYKIIKEGMKASEIEALLTDGAKIVLDGDIILDRGLNITAKDITINGNGNKLIYTATTGGEAVITVDGSMAEARVSNLGIEASGKEICGIKATEGAIVILDNEQGINVSGTNSQKLWFYNEDLYNGKSNTASMLNQIGAEALAATAANLFFIGSKDGTFGQGNWYIPSIGELMNVYGFSPSEITAPIGNSGATGENKAIINKALTILAEKTKDNADGAIAAPLTDGYYWSSSEYYNNISGVFHMANGFRNSAYKTDAHYLRVFQIIDGMDFSESQPQIGDVIYNDKSWSSADNYDSNKTAVGIVTEVGADGSVKIMNLKDLTFSSENSIGNFDPQNPYGGNVQSCQHTSDAKSTEDITNIKNYEGATFTDALKSGGTIKVTFETSYFSRKTENILNIKQYQEILDQYDALVKDAGYKGINLLQTDKLTVKFNEDNTAALEVQGRDMSSKALGFTIFDWQTQADINKSIEELTSAINAIRNYSSELGNNYNIITTRQDFTESLINVLTEGADKLTLADMNEESANMLALQTRQQLAINSLSLASQASQSILKLF